MNQDFAMHVTPAIARRLLLLKRINNRLLLPVGIEELADLKRLTENDFDPFVCPHTPERLAITQFLLDSELRGVVQATYHPAIDELSLLNIVRLARAQRLTILTVRRAVWRKAVGAYQLPDVTIQTPYEITGREIDARRDGILIIDLQRHHEVEQYSRAGANNRFVREFPRTVLYEAVEANPIPWASLAATLFPTMPHPWMIRTVKNNPPQWDTMQLQDFALYYNVCLFPEYITSKELLDSLKDWPSNVAAPTREQHGVFAW